MYLCTMSKNIYDNLRLDILETMIEQRDIKCRKSKADMIKHLLLDDDGKYIRETLYEKVDNETYLIGIDTMNTPHMKVISKMIERGEVRYAGLYQLNRTYFISKEKIDL